MARPLHLSTLFSIHNLPLGDDEDSELSIEEKFQLEIKAKLKKILEYEAIFYGKSQVGSRKNLKDDKESVKSIMLFLKEEIRRYSDRDDSIYCDIYCNKKLMPSFDKLDKSRKKLVSRLEKTVESNYSPSKIWYLISDIKKITKLILKNLEKIINTIS